MAPIGAHAAQIAIFSPAGNLQLSPARHSPVLLRSNRTIAKPPSARTASSRAAYNPQLLKPPIQASAAIALSGKASAARPPTRQARSDARKAFQQGAADSGAAKGLSRPALVGAVLQLAARAFTAVGLIMQRMALDDNAMVVLWRVGLGTYAVTLIPDVLSYLLAPQTVLTVLSAVEPLLVSVLAALLIPRDAALITSQQSLATALCVAGTLGCVLFTPSSASTAGSAATSRAQLHAVGTHRLMMYIILVVPVLAYLARQALHHKRKMNFGMDSKLSCLQLPTVAAISLALGRLALGILGDGVHASHWKFLLMIRSPTVLCAALLATVCLISCAYHVCQGVLETPPHLFVPLYCTISALVQLFQSMVVLREFQDESTEKIALTLSCAAVSILGIVHLSTTPARKAFRFGGKASALPSSRQHAINCLEPIVLEGYLLPSQCG